MGLYAVLETRIKAGNTIFFKLEKLLKSFSTTFLTTGSKHMNDNFLFHYLVLV